MHVHSCCVANLGLLLFAVFVAVVTASKKKKKLSEFLVF